MKESKAQKDIIDHLHSIGAWTVKTIQCNKSGVPDILACYEGRFIALEVKRDEGARKNETKPLQHRNIKQINSSGGIAAVVISVDEVKELLKCQDQK